MAATRLKRENVRIYQTDKLKFLKKASEDRGVRHDLSEAFKKKRLDAENPGSCEGVGPGSRRKKIYTSSSGAICVE